MGLRVLIFVSVASSIHGSLGNGCPLLIFNSLNDFFFTHSLFKDLMNYIDGFEECVSLIFDPNISAYTPHNKDWIKDRLYRHLKAIAARK